MVHDPTVAFLCRSEIGLSAASEVPVVGALASGLWSGGTVESACDGTDGASSLAVDVLVRVGVTWCSVED